MAFKIRLSGDRRGGQEGVSWWLPFRFHFYRNQGKGLWRVQVELRSVWDSKEPSGRSLSSKGDRDPNWSGIESDSMGSRGCQWTIGRRSSFGSLGLNWVYVLCTRRRRMEAFYPKIFRGQRKKKWPEFFLFVVRLWVMISLWGNTRRAPTTRVPSDPLWCFVHSSEATMIGGLEEIPIVANLLLVLSFSQSTVTQRSICLPVTISPSVLPSSSTPKQQSTDSSPCPRHKGS